MQPPQNPGFDTQPMQPQQVNTTFGQPVMYQTGASPVAPASSSTDRAIDAAKTVIAQTQNNPMAQARDLAALKAMYLEERYGITPQA